jgi:mono/diheme cytochrome c family protein
MLRKLLKWTGLVLILIIAGAITTIAMRQHLTYDAPYPNIKASTDTAVIAKGKNIALVTKGCVQCHSTTDNIDAVLKRGGEPSLSGSRKFETPFGIFFTPNITPHNETGIGRLTDAEIARVLRYGVKANGEAVLPFMEGLDMSDEDMTALISYLRSTRAVDSKPPVNEYSLKGRFAKAFLVKPFLSGQPAPIAKN